VGETLSVGSVIARLARAAAQVVDGASGGDAAKRAPIPRSVDAPASARGDGSRVAVTPVARRLADALEVDLASLVGSGPRGRITRADVAAAGGAATTPPHAPNPSPIDADVEIRELTRLQQVVARRMVEAKTTVPEFQVQTEVAMDAALVLRGELKAVDAHAAPSVNDLIVKASALALRAHPIANGCYRDDHFELNRRVNVGIAVAADNGLVVPTITDADTRSLGSIAAEARRLAARVRDGSVAPAELSAATFTVSNLGMYGMTAITPVINPPQAAILGVGASRTVLARAENGEIVERQLMTLTLTCDHRILYGADAAQFLSTIRDLLERPLRLL
jgi:pyruvate dehydrogenase E2 component (dihydrolipoamide acetyltransferase)